MIEPNVKIDINVGVMPFGRATVATGFAHPDRFPGMEHKPVSVITPVMPLSSSVITPGHARPIST